jgi:hypothetical protein
MLSVFAGGALRRGHLVDVTSSTMPLFETKRLFLTNKSLRFENGNVDNSAL